MISMNKRCVMIHFSFFFLKKASKISHYARFSEWLVTLTTVFFCYIKGTLPFFSGIVSFTPPKYPSELISALSASNSSRYDSLQHCMYISSGKSTCVTRTLIGVSLTQNWSSLYWKYPSVLFSLGSGMTSSETLFCINGSSLELFSLEVVFLKLFLFLKLKKLNSLIKSGITHFLTHSTYILTMDKSSSKLLLVRIKNNSSPYITQIYKYLVKVPCNLSAFYRAYWWDLLLLMWFTAFELSSKM